MIINESIENKINEIANILFAANFRTKQQDDLSLLSGELGSLLFLSYYSLLYPEKNKCITIEYKFDLYFEKLISTVLPFTYCNGISGVLFYLRFAEKNLCFNIDYTDIKNHYSQYLYESMNSSFNNCNYDFLHGAMGIALCQMDDYKFIEAAINGLERNAIVEGKKMKWISILDENKNKGFNISLSHGISSIIIILCRIYNETINSQQIKVLITGAVNYILSQKINQKSHGCFFPIQSLENSVPIQKGRLAWCYGDLGVALALWKAGNTLKNESWKAMSIEIMSISMDRKIPGNTLVTDAGLCHGSAGIAMIYRYMYYETENTLFLDTSDYWISITLKMARFSDGLAGYKTWNGEYKNDYSLLTGISGIGLMLLSVKADSQSFFKWTELLLL